MKRSIAIIVFSLLSFSVCANDSDAQIKIAENVLKELKAIGGDSDFVNKVVMKVKDHKCRPLIELLSDQSPYKADQEYFYAKCVFLSRNLGELGEHEAGELTFQIENGGKLVVPNRKVVVETEKNGKKSVSGIDVLYLLESGKFELYDVKIYTTGPQP